MNNQAIGVFDSGLGGLTVYKAIKKILPEEAIIYLGDTARIPYGTRSAETIVRYSLEDASFLVKRHVKVIVVACNTASSYAINALKERFDVPILGVILPGAEAALNKTKNKVVGVIGTVGTINSNAYGQTLKEMDKDVQVISAACPLFVPLVEEGWFEGDVVEAAAKKYLSSFKLENIDTLILACTHYPLLKTTIQKIVGDGVSLVDSAEACAHELKIQLNKKDLLCEKRMSQDHIYVTDMPGNFETIAARFLGGGLPSVKRVEL